MSGRSSVKPISLSLAHSFTLNRDPNLPPPGRTSHLPISSQGSPGPSSSPPPPPANDMRNHTTPRSSAEHIISDYLSISPEEEGEEEDPEFAGMEVIGATQWEREVPTFKKKSRTSTRVDVLVEETEDIAHSIEGAAQWAKDEEMFATRSPIAGPSPQPIRTPVFSLTHTSSDLPSGAYPQTPQTPHHPHKVSSPVSWSLSPLSSRSRLAKRTQSGWDKPGDNAILFDTPVARLSDDNDDDSAVNDENVPPSRIVLDERQSPLIRTGKGKRRIIDSDDEETLSRQLSVERQDKGKGRATAVLSSSMDRQVVALDHDELANMLFPLDDEPTPKHSAGPPNSSNKSNSNNRTTGEISPEAEGEAPLDTQYSDFDDFPFDEIDLDAPIPHSKTPSALASSGDGAKRTTKRSSQAPPTIDTNRVHKSSCASRPAVAGQGHVAVIDDDDISNRVAIAEAVDQYYIPLIPDLPERWQEFYLNHWRRGADGKSKSKSTFLTGTAGGKKGQGQSRVVSRNGVELVSESDEDDDDDEAYDDNDVGYGASAKKRGRAGTTTKGGRSGPAVKRGTWGRRGAWRGRGRGRGVARKR
ncbi:hypothetical protein I316_00686 [Kwoniella heveanensis BCC8398]|uniref:Uncharacterized protein n=1 Tax=Kwoniella heveanensis BCC8398 TaxID=1296120 RepID=A0A1B9H2S1_9TREE|nr:hypothetical protein I316_00686 [Kwoniella heveanensis BCC8398]